MSLEQNDNPEEELPDWLKGLSNEESDGEDEGSMDTASDSEVPADDKNISSLEPPGTGELFEAATNKKASEFLQGDFEKDDTDNWLQSIREQQGILAEDEAKEEEPNPIDYLERIQDLKKEEEELEEDPQSFLDSIADDPISEKEAEFLDSSKIDEGNMDWLSGISEEITPPLKSELVDDRLSNLDDGDNEEDIEIPDWLKKIKSGEESAVVEEQSDEETLSIEKSGETGDWMDQFTESEEADSGSPKSDFNLAENLAWIQEQDVSTGNTDEIIVDSESPEGSTPSEDPGWLSSMEDNSLADSEIEMPDIIIEEQPIGEDEFGKPPGGTDSSISKQEDALSPADMPSWLQAIRPEGMFDLLGEDGDYILGETETTGPLAGIGNVLPAEPGNILFSLNKVPKVDLYVSKTQQAHVSIMNEMMTKEEESPPIERRIIAIPQQVLRWIIAAVLYLAVMIPVFSGQMNAPLPNSTTPEIAAMSDIVNALPPGSPVLVAFEYQPGLSGEMEAASAAVLDHLLIRGSELVFISTSPTGPGLIEHYLETLLASHSYISNKLYPNLGFISGGTAALLNFATSPQNTVPMVHMDNNEGQDVNAWSIEPLNQINHINDFAMILVITDDPDTARSWIEQVEPYLSDNVNPENNVPLTMVISAQAEPLIYPYYDNSPRQVSGLVSGLSGGATYETISVRENIASRYWDGFGNGLSVTILIILFGGIFNFLNSRRNNGKKVR